MARYRIAADHYFSAGHRLNDYKGPCARLHGHNYRARFVVESKFLDAQGMVMDFGIVKAKLGGWIDEHWDHRFLICMRDPIASRLVELDPHGVVVVPFNPTAENMAKHLAGIWSNLYDVDSLVACTIQETPKCSASYRP